MVTLDEMTDEEFYEHVATILRHELGTAGFARFVSAYCTGSGDYTRDRYKWLGGLTVDEIMKDIRSRAEQPPIGSLQP
jgi:hypothetical protein